MIKFNKINKKAQTSIELIVTILVTSSIVISTTALFFPKLKTMFENEKIAWTYKIARGSKVYRSDFEPIKVSVPDAEKQRKRNGKKTTGVSSGSETYGETYGDGSAATGGKEGSGEGVKGGTEDDTYLEKKKAEELAQRKRKQRENAGYSPIDDANFNKDGTLKTEAERKNELEGLSQEDKDKLELSSKLRQEEADGGKRKIFDSKSFKFWKILIVLGVIIFIILIFVKSKKEKD